MPNVELPTAGLSFLAGFLTFISPCVLPLVPAYVSYLGARVTQQNADDISFGGRSIGKASLARGAVLLHAICFVLGLMFVFVLTGITLNAGLHLIGNAFFDFKPTLEKVGGVIAIFFGLHVMGVTGWVLRRLSRVNWERFGAAGKLIGGGVERIQATLYADTRRRVDPRNPYGYAGSAFMGVAFAAGWAPCTGPIYGTILSVAVPQSLTTGALLLTVYSLGLGIPFLLTAIALDPMRNLLRRMQRHTRLIEVVSGLLLVFMGYLLATNQLAEISGRLSGLADFSYNLEECVTGTVSGKVPLAEFGTCMQLGPNYQYLNDGKTVSLLIGGEIVHVG